MLEGMPVSSHFKSVDTGLHMERLSAIFLIFLEGTLKGFILKGLYLFPVLFCSRSQVYITIFDYG